MTEIIKLADPNDVRELVRAKYGAAALSVAVGVAGQFGETDLGSEIR